MFESQLLEQIDQESYDAHCAVVAAVVDYSNKALAILESYTDEELTQLDFFCEADTSSTTRSADSQPVRQGIVQRIWGVLKSVGKWIVNLIKTLGAKIKALFSRKVNKSTDQICDEVGISPTSATTSVPSMAQQSPQSPQKSRPIKKYRVKIPQNRRSTTKAPDGVAIAKELSLIFDKNGKFRVRMINVATYRLEKIDGRDGSDENVVGQCETSPIHMTQAALVLLGDNTSIALSKIAQYICDAMNDSANYNKLATADQLLNDMFYEKSFDTQRAWFTLNRLTNTQTVLSKAFSKIDNANIMSQKNMTNVQIRSLQHIVSVFEQIQNGLNIISASVEAVYDVDVSYMNSVNNVETLGKFVQASINAGIPSKYIARNAWLISDTSIKGSNTDVNAPIWGQTRVIFFPDKTPNVVYKIALSGAGVHANKNEELVSQTMTKWGEAHRIAKTTGSYVNQTVVVADRVDTSSTIDQNSLRDIVYEFKQLEAKHGSPFHITDLHKGNFGRDAGGNWIVIDYGNIVKQ